ncbi:MAG TPA: hypothetical protein PK453_05410 [Leptospiraceae bacterium]|nr:hypothetical protein [Leptospiraceae bacterium]HNF13086.1 hypothetical protein [Leptospiraceae bacterium]HNM03511.1 hypothetical protein [Leptospiraceae bacterium]
MEKLQSRADCELCLRQDSMNACLINGKCKRLALYCQLRCQEKVFKGRDRCINSCWKDY